jgi:transcriptional regulator with XRE-family HTH domain
MRKRLGSVGTAEVAFGRALKEFRTAAKVSQEQLGLESGYHSTYISMLERGLYSPSFRTILALAKVLKINPALVVDRAYKILGGG